MTKRLVGEVGLGLATMIVLITATACGTHSAHMKRLDQQTDVERIRETLRQYAIFLDDARVDDFLDLFTEDAVFTAAGLIYEGREEIRDELADKPRRLGKHLPFPALIQLESATEARAWSDFLRVMIENEGDPTSWVITSVGRYYDRLAKGEDGRWRLQRRDVQILAMENPKDLIQPAPHRR